METSKLAKSKLQKQTVLLTVIDQSWFGCEYPTWQNYFIFDILFYLECLLILASPTLLQTLEPYTRRYLTRRLPAIRKFSPLLCPRKMRESLNLMVTFIHFVFLAWHFFPSFFSLSTKKKLSISFSFVYFLDENTVWKNSH